MEKSAKNSWERKFFGTKVPLSTVTTQKIGEWHLVQRRTKRWSINALFTRMTFTQLLIMTDSALKLDYTTTVTTNTIGLFVFV